MSEQRLRLHWGCGWNLANLPNLGCKFSTKGQPPRNWSGSSGKVDPPPLPRCFVLCSPASLQSVRIPPPLPCPLHPLATFISLVRPGRPRAPTRGPSRNVMSCLRNHTSSLPLRFASLLPSPPLSEMTSCRVKKIPCIQRCEIVVIIFHHRPTHCPRVGQSVVAPMHCRPTSPALGCETLKGRLFPGRKPRWC